VSKAYRLVFALASLAVLFVGPAAQTPLEETAGATTTALPANRPNILLIVTDDQSWSNFTRPLMPNVFRELVDKGVLFRRAYVESSLCCPSRAQILTGLSGFHNGVDANNIRISRPLFVEALHDLGYRTMLAGKFLNNSPCTPRAGFDRYICTADVKAHYTLVNPDIAVDGTWTHFTGYTTDILADFVNDFVASTPPDKPFFAVYTPPSPHLPANDDRCSGVSVNVLRDPSFDEDTRATGKPAYMQRPAMTMSEVGTVTRQYTTMTKAVPCLDKSIAKILAGLGTRAADTLVFFMSDNGYLYGQHRRWEKVVPYEEAVRVPLVVRYPRLVSETQPFATSALAANVDIAATIADILGIQWAGDGKSLKPLLTRQSTTVRSATLISNCQGQTYPCEGNEAGNLWGQKLVPSYFGVVTPRYKYLDYITGEKELYDLSVDPFETRNLAGTSGAATVQAQLASKLAQLRETTVNTTIVRGPSGPQSDARTFAFTYFSQSRFARYRCRLSRNGVAGPWTACNGQSVLQGPLGDGNYVFDVAGVDENGSMDQTPAARTFSLASSGPSVVINSAPPLDGANRSATFRYSSSTAGAAFQCRLVLWGGTGPWQPCAGSGITYNSLSDGLWSFEVRAVDTLGAVSRPPAHWLFNIDSTGPKMIFDSAPNPRTQSSAARFVFHPDEAIRGITTCALDGGTPIDCTNGSFDAPGLPAGSHTLVVRATDKSGTIGLTSFSWTIDRTRPLVTINGPSGTTSSTTATFTLSANEPLIQRYCRLDAAFYFAPCSGSITYSGLSNGTHTFSAMVVDKAKNFSVPVSRTWEVRSTG
jgi:arylsulfatase A-like enzyme